MNVAAKWHMPSPHFDSLCPGLFTDCCTVALMLSATHFLLLLRNCESNQSKRAERFVLLTFVWHTALLRLERDLYVFEHPLARAAQNVDTRHRSHHGQQRAREATAQTALTNTWRLLEGRLEGQA